MERQIVKLFIFEDREEDFEAICKICQTIRPLNVKYFPEDMSGFKAVKAQLGRFFTGQAKYSKKALSALEKSVLDFEPDAVLLDYLLFGDNKFQLAGLLYSALQQRRDMPKAFVYTAFLDKITEEDIRKKLDEAGVLHKVAAMLEKRDGMENAHRDQEHVRAFEDAIRKCLKNNGRVEECLASEETGEMEEESLLPNQ